MLILHRNQAALDALAARKLAEAKLAAVAAINAKAGIARTAFITQLPGQEMIYIAKEAEALRYLADPVADLAAFPMLAAEVGITAPTALQLAQIWANMGMLWRGVAAQIEGGRMTAIYAVDASTSIAAIDALRAPD